MNWLKFLLGFSSLLVAGCAAYFSVTGLGVLFSGASVAVMIMAGTLEFAKLVSATYLKQKWTEISGLNKTYLTTAVGVLMIITSAGIFGFLSNAFQQQNIKLEQVQREISVWETKIKSSESQILSLTNQVNGLQSNQGKIIDNGKVNNNLLKSIDNRDNQVTIVQGKISSLQDSVLKYNEQINNIKNNNINLEKEVGGFRFVAEAFNLELNTVVKFFIFLIVFVFDPLAMALIIGFNQMLTEKKKEEDPIVIPVEPTLPDVEVPKSIIKEQIKEVYTPQMKKVIDHYLIKTNQTFSELMSGSNQYGPYYILNLVKRALKENKKVVFVSEKTDGEDLGMGKYVLQPLDIIEEDVVEDMHIDEEEIKEDHEDIIPVEVEEEDEKKNLTP